MKKNFLKMVALMAVALPMAMLTSCDNEEEIKPGQKEHENHFPDESGWITNRIVTIDEEGSVFHGYGQKLDESEPTVLYVGADDLEDAKNGFIVNLAPAGSPLDVKGDNMTLTLTDTLGHVKNKIFFTAVNDGKILAKVTWERELGIENYVTELRYISKSLWPENAASTSPFVPGRIYKHNNDNYVCFRSIGYGEPAILFRVANKKVFHGGGWFSKVLAEEAVEDYPCRSTFTYVYNQLQSTSAGSQFKQKLTACAGLKNIKDWINKDYWTCDVKSYDEVYVANLATGKITCEDLYCGIFYDESWYWESFGYFAKLNDKGEVYMRQDCGENQHEDARDYKPTLDSFERNLEMEQIAQSIPLQ